MNTDKRDARRLAGLHRAGELTPIAVPTPEQEGVRDLCRIRGQMVSDLTRARNRLSGFLLRHGVVWRGGSNWTSRHERWLASLHFEQPAVAAGFRHYRAAVQLRDASLEAIEGDLGPWCERAPSASRSGAWPPSEASRRSAVSAWPPRCSTGGAFPTPASS